MHYAKIHFGDYARDTSHLTMLEHGAYFQLMRLYYTTERPIPLDLGKVYRLVDARSEAEIKAVIDVVSDFFVKSPDGWRQKRIDREIEKYRKNADINAENGKCGGRPKKETDSVNSENRTGCGSEPDGNPLETLTINHKPITNTKPKTLRAVSTAPASFGNFWFVWPSSPRKVAKSKCLEAWIRHSLDGVADQIIAHVTAMKGSEQWRKGFEPAPLTYLNQRRWEDGSPEEAKPERRLAL